MSLFTNKHSRNSGTAYERHECMSYESMSIAYDVSRFINHTGMKVTQHMRHTACIISFFTFKFQFICYIWKENCFDVTVRYRCVEGLDRVDFIAML